ncbi:MAG: SH3 domain-containing protein [Clostridia bacterium]|nr:SH3 domain-containing protein [Clostridia bacterium]
MNVKHGKRLIFFAVMLLLLCAIGAALGETARVITPGGALNIRKKADEKSTPLESVPNKTLVEVEEVGEVWSRVVYKKKTGYVKTQFLKLASKLPGQTVYLDGGSALLRAEPAEGAAILGPISCASPVEVLSVEGDWAKALVDGREGWVETSHFTFQYQEPAGTQDWMKEAGTAVAPCELTTAPGKEGKTVLSLAAGTAVTVTMIENDRCLVLAEEGCGWADISKIALTGPTEGEAVIPTDAAAAAEKALKKQFKAFGKTNLYSAVQAEGNAWRFGYFAGNDQYAYGALVDAATAKVLLTRDYTGFAVPPKASAALPEGEMAVTLSTETLAVGEVLDITVAAWENCQTRYTLAGNGKKLAESEKGDHFTAAYRPREAGEYVLTVTVTDKNSLTRTAEAAFTVVGSLSPKTELDGVYSQKDGWWKDKKYRHSNLGKSGCAIFTLSHALQRMGHTEDAALPENLATKYAYCLIPEEGTSNELLINTAARDFGFKTRGKLYDDKNQILQLLDEGAYFSFSIARGHIALVCGRNEDGTMIRVVDSAPGATFERINGAAPSYQTRSGAYRAALSPEDLPGARWYFETDEYGGLEYWLPIDYVVKRGVRLIQPLTESEK